MFAASDGEQIAERRPGAIERLRTANGIVHPSREFTETAFETTLRTGAELVHIATHFQFQAAAPDRSYLLLDDGKRLGLGALRSSKFDFSGIELLVLAACETAVHDEGPYGPESLAALAQTKGAKRVLGTLWPVMNDSAAALMTTFYEFAFATDEPPFADALRDAQLCIKNSDGRSGPELASAATRGLAVSGLGRWSHPYHWAGYVLFEPSS